MKLKCLLCKKPLTNLDPTGNQPSGGTEFITHGHYGSAVTDHIDNTGYAVNICDPCLLAQKTEKTVIRIFPAESAPRPRPTYKVWR